MKQIQGIHGSPPKAPGIFRRGGFLGVAVTGAVAPQTPTPRDHLTLTLPPVMRSARLPPGPSSRSSVAGFLPLTSARRGRSTFGWSDEDGVPEEGLRSEQIWNRDGVRHSGRGGSTAAGRAPAPKVSPWRGSFEWLGQLQGEAPSGSQGFSPRPTSPETHRAKT